MACASERDHNLFTTSMTKIELYTGYNRHDTKTKGNWWRHLQRDGRSRRKNTTEQGEEKFRRSCPLQHCALYSEQDGAIALCVHLRLASPLLLNEPISSSLLFYAHVQPALPLNKETDCSNVLQDHATPPSCEDA